MDGISALTIINRVYGVIAIERLMGVFFDKRKTSFIVMLLSYLVLLAPVLVFGHEILGTAVNPVVGTIVVLIVTFNYESSIAKKVVATISILIFVLAVDTLHIILYVPILSGLNEIEFFIASIITLGLLPLGAAVLLRRIKFIRSQTMDTANLWVYTFLITTFAVFFSAFFIFIIVTPNMPLGFFISAFIFALLFGFLIFYSYRTLSTSYEVKLKSALQAQEKEYYATQLQLMQESTQSIISFRHDLKAHFSTLIDFTKKGDSQEATAYLYNLLGTIEKAKIYSNTGNIAIDSIINYKLKDIENENIKLDLKVAVPPDLGVESPDIVAILGNLLSNALEALEKVQGDKTLKLDIELNPVGLYIKVKNNYTGQIKYSRGVDKQIVTIKPGSGHGYGLGNVRQAVAKYDGYLKLTHEDEVFSAIAFLCVG